MVVSHRVHPSYIMSVCLHVIVYVLGVHSVYKQNSMLQTKHCETVPLCQVNVNRENNVYHDVIPSYAS